MQRKGERQTMTGKEYCRYIRTYSELEGLQRAHTVVYCAQTVPGGVLAQLRWEQAGTVQYGAGSAGQFCPDDAAFALSVREQHRPGTVAGGAGGRVPALPAAAGSTAARRHPPGKRLFLWHLLILYR